jgi:peptidoglycan/LPS O-acetylase OafA/YrhL
MVSESKSALLHAIRWIAALVVLLGHAQMYARQKTGSGAFWWEYVGNHAHAGVVLFFVLSGFVISWSVDKSEELTWKKYYVYRFSRIYSVLPFAIIFTIIVDLVGGWLSNAYSNPGLIPQNNYVVRLLVNIFSVQGFQGYRVQFGSNPALWSIGYEFFYYIVFGLIFFWREIFHSKILLASVVTLGLFILAGTNITLYFLIWMLGFIAYRIQKQVTLNQGYFWLFLLQALLVNHFVVYKALGTVEYLRDFSLGVAVAALFVPATPAVGALRVNKFFADFSYSLYAFHMPILFFAYFVILNETYSVKMFSMAAVAFCIGLAWLLSMVTEKKRFVFRGWLMSYFKVKVQEKSTLQIIHRTTDG